MRRTVALALALPLALLTAGALAGQSGPDADAPPAMTADHSKVAAPVPPAAPEAAAEARDRSHAGPEGAPDAEGTVAATAGPETVVARPADGTAASDPVGPGPSEATFLIAAVPDAGAIVGTGPRWRYTIEVEPQLGVDVESLAVEVRAALTDERSWVRTRTLEQVDDPARARIRVVLATPDTVDELCGQVGLRTAGIYSCWNGRFAALNGWRWEVGADAFDDITTYRNYLVNHEFGHGLGYGHVGCPAEGAPAPVMMQQTKGVGGCLANGWPYP